MERAIKDLCRLSGDALFREIAVGIGHVMDTANGLDAAAHQLAAAEHHHPARVLRNLAEEEAAKALILIDAVRCPPGNQQERNRILAYFYCHLAKGIYADVCYWRPINFMEVRKGVDDLRSAYFLDGPNDVDWIFDNSIIQQREDDLYVGYVREDTQEEGQGNCHWTSPVSGVSSLTNKMLGSTTPAILQLARALYDVKATSFEGLPVIAEIWRSVGLHDEMRFDELEQTNLKTLEALNPHSPYESVF